MESTVTTLGCSQLLCGQIIHKLSMSEMLGYLRKYRQERLYNCCLDPRSHLTLVQDWSHSSNFPLSCKYSGVKRIVHNTCNCWDSCQQAVLKQSYRDLVMTWCFVGREAFNDTFNILTHFWVKSKYISYALPSTVVSFKHLPLLLQPKFDVLYVRIVASDVSIGKGQLVAEAVKCDHLTVYQLEMNCHS